MKREFEGYEYVDKIAEEENLWEKEPRKYEEKEDWKYHEEKENEYMEYDFDAKEYDGKKPEFEKEFRVDYEEDYEKGEGKRKPKSIIRGKVVEGCYPVEGATVQLLDECGKLIASTVTRCNGEFEFCEWLKPGKYSLFAAKPGFTASRLITVCVRPCKWIFVVLQIYRDCRPKVGTLFGVVRSICCGEPVACAQVELYAPFQKRPTAIAKTNKKGEFCIECIPVGCYKAVIRAECYKTLCTRVEIREGKNQQCFLLTPGRGMSGCCCWDCDPCKKKEEEPTWFCDVCERKFGKRNEDEDEEDREDEKCECKKWSSCCCGSHKHGR